METFVRTILAWRVVTILLILMASAFLLAQVKSLKIIMDSNDFLPQSHPYVVTTNKVEQLFGSRYVSIIAITPTSGDIFQPAIIEKVRHITEGVVKTPRVIKTHVLSLTARKAKDIQGAGMEVEARPFIGSNPPSQIQLDALREALLRNPVYQNTIVARDFKTTAVLVEYRNGAGGMRAIMDSLEPIVARERDASVNIAIGGLPVLLAQLERLSQRMAILFPLAVLLVGLIHFEAFRTLQGLFLPLVTALLATFWAVGVMGLAHVPMDAFNATTPILILAIAAGHAVQLLKRYYEDYERLSLRGSLTPRQLSNEAIVVSLVRVGPVMLTAGLAAAAGFFSLVIFDVSSVRTFGIFTGIGILSSLVVELTFIPAVRSLLPPPKGERIGQGKAIWTRITNTIASWVTGPKGGLVFGASALIVAVAVVGGARVIVDTSTKGFFSQELSFMRDDDLLNQRLGGTNTIYVLVEGDREDRIEDPVVMKGIASLQEWLQSQPNIGKTTSIADFVKRMNQAMHGEDPQFHSIPDSRELNSQYLLLYSMSGDPSDFENYINGRHSAANIYVFSKVDSSATIEDLIERMNLEIAKIMPSDVHVSVGGGVPASAALNQIMVHSKILNIVQIAGAVFVISALVFRSAVAGALVLLPLALTVVVNFGVMGWLGMRLNIPNAISLAMGIGIGADYAIYLIYRLREEISAGKELTEAIRTTLNTAGQACLFVASAVALGYGVLWFSPGFYIHTWLATLVFCSMMTSVLAALTLIPLVVFKFRPAFIFHRARSNLGIPASRVGMWFVVIMVAAALMAGRAHAQVLTADEIMKRNFVASRVQDSTSSATWTLVDRNGQERVRKTTGPTKLKPNGIDNMRLIRFNSPADVKGTVTVLIENSSGDDNIMVYLPALKQVRRLSANSRRDSFVGSDYSYGDLLGHRPQEWTNRLVGESAVDGIRVWIVESMAKSDAVRSQSGYAKRVNWIAKDSFISIKGEVYDEQSELLKLYHAQDIRLVDAAHQKYVPMKLDAQNVQTGHRTVIQISDYKANQNVSDALFTARYMEREQ